MSSARIDFFKEEEEEVEEGAGFFFIYLSYWYELNYESWEGSIIV